MEKLYNTLKIGEFLNAKMETMIMRFDDEQKKRKDISANVVFSFKLSGGCIETYKCSLIREMISKLEIKFYELYAQDVDVYTIRVFIKAQDTKAIEAERKKLYEKLRSVSNISMLSSDIIPVDRQCIDKLYIYRVWNKHTREIIKSNCLYLSDPKSFNDIFDCQFQMFYRNQRINLDDKIGVRCFSEKNDSILMWSHYADAHRGICIGFSQRYLLDYAMREHEPCVIFPVEYRDRIPLYIGVDEIDKARYHTYKYVDWKYESEHRLLYKDGRGILFHFPPKALTDVYLGCKMKSEDKYDVQEWVKETNRNRTTPITIHVMEPKIDEFKVVPTKAGLWEEDINPEDVES